MKIDPHLKPAGLAARIDRLWDLSAAKIRAIERRHGSSRDTLVYTVNGRYTSRGWTEWTLGFRYGSALLQFDATGDRRFLDLARRRTLESMGPHLTDAGVHDHGFTIVSTYGNLLRLGRERRFEHDAWERRCYETALACSAAVQARRWTSLGEGEGFIHSFNGPQSLFVDTIRTLRSLALGHRLGHVLLEEGRPARLAARPARDARALDGPIPRLGWPRARHLRRARAGVSRGDLQRHGSQFQVPEHPAGLLPVHHVDARSGLGDVRLCRAARVHGHGERPGRSARRRASSGRRVHEAGRDRDVRLLPRAHAGRRRSVLGHRRAGPPSPR